MRIAFVIVMLASFGLGGCGKKKSPQAPAASQQETKEDGELRDANAPAGGDESDNNDTRSADPQEGGE